MAGSWGDLGSKGVWADQALVSRAPRRRGQRQRARNQNRMMYLFCHLFLIPHQHDLLVTRAWLSCLAGSFQGPPKRIAQRWFHRRHQTLKSRERATPQSQAWHCPWV